MKVTHAGKSKSIKVDTVVEKDACEGDACPYRPKRQGAKRKRTLTLSSPPTSPVSAPVPVEPAAPPAVLLRMQELMSALDHFAVGDRSQASLTLWLTALLNHPTLSAMDFVFQLRSMH